MLITGITATNPHSFLEQEELTATEEVMSEILSTYGGIYHGGGSLSSSDGLFPFDTNPDPDQTGAFLEISGQSLGPEWSVVLFFATFLDRMAPRSTGGFLVLYGDIEPLIDLQLVMRPRVTGAQWMRRWGLANNGIATTLDFTDPSGTYQALIEMIPDQVRVNDYVSNPGDSGKPWFVDTVNDQRFGTSNTSHRLDAIIHFCYFGTEQISEELYQDLMAAAISEYGT
jgi:hypothetical protein